MSRIIWKHCREKGILLREKGDELLSTRLSQTLSVVAR